MTDIPTDWDARREIVIEARELLQEFDVALKYFRDGLLLFGCMTTEAIGQFYQVDGIYDSKPIVGCEIVPTLTFKESRT